MHLICVFSLTVLGISARPQLCDPIFEECAKDTPTTESDPIFDERNDVVCDDPIFCGNKEPIKCFEDINEIEDSSDNGSGG